MNDSDKNSDFSISKKTYHLQNIQALFDSGAYRNYIKRTLTDGETVEDLGYNTYMGIHRVILANNSIVEGEKIRFEEIKIKDFSEKEPEFVIMDNLYEDVIIGAYLMQRFGINLDFSNDKLVIIPKNK